MNRRSILSLSAMIVLGLALLPGSAIAQQKTIKEQLVGTWTLVSWDAKNKDGTMRNPMVGPNLKGALILDSAGGAYFMAMTELPKLASNDRLKTTPEENRAIAQGTFNYFGTYSVDEAEKSFSVRVERSSYGNQVGTNNKRMITSLTADELKFRVPVTTSGGSNEWTWRRAK